MMANRSLPNSNAAGFAACLALLLGGAALPAEAAAPAPSRLTGSLLGRVADGTGVPQMGAAVYLFNRYDKLVQKAVTNLKGDFLFDSLPPDAYSVRVTLATFVPALKRNILIQPGIQSVLAINLASVFSSIELVYSAPKSGALMSDEWKWVLRSSMDTRPVLRVLPDLRGPGRGTMTIFSDTQGLVRLSSGEATPFGAVGNQPDLGTTFALATSVFGSNRVQFTGNLGYAVDGAVPSTGFRTTFSRAAEVNGPELKLTMQQTGLPVRSGALVGAQQSDNLPVLRRMSVTAVDHARIGEGVELDYGTSLDSVAFFDRLNYLSPFARVSFEIAGGMLRVGYSSGAPPIELLESGIERSSGLQQDVAALSLLPRVSLRAGRAFVQRTENFEASYEREMGDRTYSIGFYREDVRNGAVTISGADEVLAPTDLLPELSSQSSVFNIGRYDRLGFIAAVTQDLTDDYRVTVAYGNSGILRAGDTPLATDVAEDLRNMLRQSRQHTVTGRFSGVFPVAGTKLNASYTWADTRSLVPVHVFFTQRINSDIGLNVRIRQPIPSVPGIPGRLEATADLRNLVAQGYLPIATTGGRRMLLTHSPRAVRGGLSFIF